MSVTTSQTSKTSTRTIRIFSARACSTPLEEAAVLFTKQTGIDVKIDVCNRHCAVPVAEEAAAAGNHDDFLVEISEMGVHDLAIAGAEYLLDDGEVRGIVQRGKRRTIACRTAGLVVPKGNPANVRALADMARPGVRVAISVLDCLKGLWEDICGRAGLIDAVRKNITFKANGCIAIVEAVADKLVDAAFGWTAFQHLEDDRIEVVPLPPEQSVARGTCIGMLSFCEQPDVAEQLMDFLTTEPAQACYRKYGWKT